MRKRLVIAGLAAAIWTILFYNDEFLCAKIRYVAIGDRMMRDIPIYASLIETVRPLGKWPAILMTASFLFWYHPQGRRWGATTVLAVAATVGLTEVLWRTVSRVRPNMSAGRTVFMEPFLGFTGGRYAPSFASSEAAVSMALATILSAAVPNLRVLWIFAALGVAVLRVEADAHFPSDVWAGSVVGFACARTAILLTQRRAAPAAAPTTSEPRSGVRK